MRRDCTDYDDYARIWTEAVVFCFKVLPDIRQEVRVKPRNQVKGQRYPTSHSIKLPGTFQCKSWATGKVERMDNQVPRYNAVSAAQAVMWLCMWRMTNETVGIWEKRSCLIFKAVMPNFYVWRERAGLPSHTVPNIMKRAQANACSIHTEAWISLISRLFTYLLIFCQCINLSCYIHGENSFLRS
jgi:hypothetical protein